jgi:hypothetical protein
MRFTIEKLAKGAGVLRVLRFLLTISFTTAAPRLPVVIIIIIIIIMNNNNRGWHKTPASGVYTRWVHYHTANKTDKLNKMKIKINKYKKLSP